VEGLVREHHAEAERVVRAIALVHGHVVVGEALLHQEREVKPAGAAADDCDLHAAASCMRAARGSSLRPTPSWRSRMRSNQAARTSPAWSTVSVETTRAHWSTPNRM